jgi:deoxycytidylate deaminase
MNSSDLLNIDNKYFQMAKTASTFSDFYKQHHLGCVMIYKGKPIAISWNTLKTNPIQKEYNKYRHFDFESSNNGAIHAELGALIKTKNMDIDWNKVKVFIYREHKNGIAANSCPCPACERAMRDRGIRNIYFTTEYGTAHERIDF